MNCLLINRVWVVLLTLSGLFSSVSYAQIIIDDFTVGPTNTHWDIVNGGNLNIQQSGLPEANVWGGSRDIHAETLRNTEYIDMEIESGKFIFSSNLAAEELGLSYRSSTPMNISGENSAFAISFGDLGSDDVRIWLVVRDNQGAGEFAWVTGAENSTVMVPTSALDSLNDSVLDRSSITLIGLGLYRSPYVEVKQIAFVPEPNASRCTAIAVAMSLLFWRRQR